MKAEVLTPQVKEADTQNGSLEVEVNNSPSLEEPRQPRVYKRARKEKGATGKDRVSKIPPCTPGKRSSIYRGVTRHRWTGRYEAHLWDKSTWNATQKKKGKQVYLGAYDEEESAARAYDLAALKYWGPSTLTNFPVTDYTKDIEEMQNVSREEYLASLRRKSSGFSRGVSKYRGVARHHHNGRWEARIGRVFGNKYLYLGTYSTQEEAAAAYDMAAIEYRGLNAVTNFDLSRYIRWLRPSNIGANQVGSNDQSSGSLFPNKNQENTPHSFENNPPMSARTQKWGYESSFPQFTPSTPSDFNIHSKDSFTDIFNTNSPSMHQCMPFLQQKSSNSPTALSLLLQSNMFRQMLEKTAAATHHQPQSPATMDSSALEQFQLDDDENEVEIDYKDLFPNSTHIELSDYSSKEAEADMNNYNIDYQDAGCNDALINHHQHISKMFPTELQIATDIYASPSSSSVFDSYTNQQSPHFTPNLNDIIVEDQEGQGQILSQEDSAALSMWNNAFRTNSVSSTMQQTPVALSRCCRTED
ncbi:hypothetical protein GOP47_0028552 [Adiantum capillus-veneris]|nr:hypothetical protein GOP47_0028552 [Adiantum capillus-veneris]